MCTAWATEEKLRLGIPVDRAQQDPLETTMLEKAQNTSSDVGQMVFYVHSFHCIQSSDQFNHYTKAVCPEQLK